MIQTKEATLQKYPAYKDSGVEWLGEIPEQWNLLPAKRFHEVIKQVNKNRTRDNVLSLTLRGVVNNDLDNPEGLVPKDYATYQLFNKNNLVFKLIDLENISTSRVGLVHERGIMSSAYIRLVIGSNCFPRYAYYYYFSLYKNEVYNKLGSGVRSTLGPRDLLNLPFLKPALSEQTAIAHFLDNKTTKIDTAIAQKEKMIALLKERKQIVIQNAVTGKWSMTDGKWGPTPKEIMKDSGVEWIGEVPVGWEVKRLRNLGQTQNGISAGAEYFGKGYPFVSYGDVYKNIELPKVVKGLAQSSEEDQKQYSVKKGDVFFTRTSETIEEVGFSSVCMHTINNSTFGGFLIRFRPTSNNYLYEGYSKFYFSSVIHRAYFVKEMNLVTRASLSQELLKNLPTLLPSLEEQKEIADYIETQSTKIEQAITLQQSQIEKLKEYKATLIDSAVTGKIKVTDE